MSKTFDSELQSTFLSGITRNLKEKNGDFSNSKSIKSHIPTLKGVTTPPVFRQCAKINNNNTLLNIIFDPLPHTMKTPLVNKIYLEQDELPSVGTQANETSKVQSLIAKFELIASQRPKDLPNNPNKNVKKQQINVTAPSHILQFNKTILNSNQTVLKNMQSLESPSETIFDISSKIKIFEEKVRTEKKASEPTKMSSKANIDRLYSFQSLKRFFESLN
ncbi:hypothetical protein NGRA_1954 [Nosema granulosis]|uniref:Uncharacterized protein n=1 Tax=Nosema granulosis TaxID=83296 RepID=A0A9P6GYF6_9MICR|nr:hypothetical protein NGRA_1954 [Nosema granulosis]